ncbi:hypothetical protein NPIL_22901 [Nephila pilipes]|uniref:Uncharacterized protein n=1 Tax=Nephila pilipes TaxID=299642 RepID=A0A8X6P593_NEPPI|nr:hypothetical protein NPIL_22901 [Nephila pilipes]
MSQQFLSNGSQSVALFSFSVSGAAWDGELPRLAVLRVEHSVKAEFVPPKSKCAPRMQSGKILNVFGVRRLGLVLGQTLSTRNTLFALCSAVMGFLMKLLLGFEITVSLICPIWVGRPVRQKNHQWYFVGETVSRVPWSHKLSIVSIVWRFSSAEDQPQALAFLPLDNSTVSLLMLSPGRAGTQKAPQHKWWDRLSLKRGIRESILPTHSSRMVLQFLLVKFPQLKTGAVLEDSLGYYVSYSFQPMALLSLAYYFPSFSEKDQVHSFIEDESMAWPGCQSFTPCLSTERSFQKYL